MQQIVIITGDGGESYEALYAVHRFREAGWKPLIAAPSARRLHLVMHDFEPGWDTYVERLQATAVARAGTSRERAEAAIADVRTRRIDVFDRLTQAWRDVNGAWREERDKVSAARDALEQEADELSAHFN